MKSAKKRMSLSDMMALVKQDLGTPVDERWFIEEFVPAHTDNDDHYWPENVVERSQYFKTKQEAEDLLEELIPSNMDAKLRVRHQVCYERLERHWV